MTLHPDDMRMGPAGSRWCLDCDSCDYHIHIGCVPSQDPRLSMLLKEGWILDDDGKDYCPDCVAK